MNSIARPAVLLLLSCLLPLASCAQSASSVVGSSSEQTSFSWDEYFEVKRIEVEARRATIILKAKPADGVASYYVRIAPSDSISSKQEQTVSPSENDVTLSFDGLLAETAYNLIVGINKTDGAFLQLLEREFLTAAEYASSSLSEDSVEEPSSAVSIPSQTLCFSSIAETEDGFKVTLSSSAKTDYSYSIFYDDDLFVPLKEETREMKEGLNEISFPALRKFECGFLFRYRDLSATEISEKEIRFDQINPTDPAKVLEVTPLNLASDGFDLQIKTYNPGNRSEIQIYVGGALCSSFSENGTKVITVSGLTEATAYPVSAVAENNASMARATYGEQTVTTLAKEHGKASLSVIEKGEDFVRFNLSSVGPRENYSLSLYAHGEEKALIGPFNHTLGDGESAEITINDLEPGKTYDYRLFRISGAAAVLLTKDSFATLSYERGSAHLNARANHEDHCYHIGINGVQNPGNKTYFEIYRLSTQERVYQGQPKEGEEVLALIRDATASETFYLTAGFEGGEKTEISRVTVQPIEGEFAVDVLSNIIGGTRLSFRAPKEYETLYLTLYRGAGSFTRYEVKPGEEELIVFVFDRYELSLGEGCDVVVSGSIDLRVAESAELTEIALTPSYDSVSIQGKFTDVDGAIDGVRYQILNEGKTVSEGEITLDGNLAFSCAIDGLSEKTGYRINIVVVNRFTFTHEEKATRDFTTTSYLDEVPHGVNVTMTEATNSYITVSVTAFGEKKMTYEFYWGEKCVGHRELEPGESEGYTSEYMEANATATFSAKLFYGGEWIDAYEGQFKTTVNPLPNLKNFECEVTENHIHFEAEVEQTEPYFSVYIECAGQTRPLEWREANYYYCDFYIGYGKTEVFEFCCMYQKDGSSEAERMVLGKGTATTSAYFDLHEPEISFGEEHIAPYSYGIGFDVTYGERYAELIYDGPCDVSLLQYNAGLYSLEFPQDYDGESFTLRFYAVYGEDARLLAEKKVTLPELVVGIAEETPAEIGKEYVQIRCHAVTGYNCEVLWKWDGTEIENGSGRFDGLIAGSEHTLSLYRKRHGEFVLAAEKKYQTRDALSDFELVWYDVSSGFGDAMVRFTVSSSYGYPENLTFELWSKGAVLATVYAAGLEGEYAERHGTWTFDMGRYFCYEDIEFFAYYEPTQEYRKIADLPDVCSLHYSSFTDYELSLYHTGIRLHAGVKYNGWYAGANNLLFEVYEGETLLISKRSEEGLGGIWEAIAYVVEGGGDHTFRVVLYGLFPNGSREIVDEKEVTVRCYTPFELAEGYCFEVNESENDAPRTHLHTGCYDKDATYEGKIIYVIDGTEHEGESFGFNEEHIYGRIVGLPNYGTHELKVYLEVSGVRKLVYEGEVEGKPIAPDVSVSVDASVEEIKFTLNNPESAWTYFCRFNDEEAEDNYGTDHVFLFHNYVPGFYYHIYLYGYHEENPECVYLLSDYSTGTPEDKTVIESADVSFEYYSAVIDLKLTPGELFDEIVVYFDGVYFRFGKDDIVKGRLSQRIVLSPAGLCVSNHGLLLIDVVHKLADGTTFSGANQISRDYAIETYYNSEHGEELGVIQTSYSQNLVEEGMKVRNLFALSSLGGVGRIYVDGTLVYEISMDGAASLGEWIVLSGVTNESAEVSMIIDSPYGNYKIR